MPRKPVGTQTRPTADWFAGETASAGGLATSTVGSGIQMSLFNDAPAGQYLWLWTAEVSVGAEGLYRFALVEGAQGGLLQQGQYVMAGRGAAFGAAYSGDVPATGVAFPVAGTAIGSFGYADEFSGSPTIFTAQGPIAVLPPGFSFEVLHEWATGSQFVSITCWFYYSILPYIPS